MLANKTMNHTIRIATPTDYDAISTLLADAQMVPALYAPPSMWWVAVDRHHTVIGAIGVEPDLHAWLLRSTVVDHSNRQKGIGKHLIATVERAARGAGIETVFCFGTDVGDYWERRGYSVVPVAELCGHVPQAPQIGQFVANGWLADEVAWRKDL